MRADDSPEPLKELPPRLAKAGQLPDDAKLIERSTSVAASK